MLGRLDRPDPLVRRRKFPQSIGFSDEFGPRPQSSLLAQEPARTVRGRWRPSVRHRAGCPDRPDPQSLCDVESCNNVTTTKKREDSPGRPVLAPFCASAPTRRVSATTAGTTSAGSVQDRRRHNRGRTTAAASITRHDPLLSSPFSSVSQRSRFCGCLHHRHRPHQASECAASRPTSSKASTSPASGS